VEQGTLTCPVCGISNVRRVPTASRIQHRPGQGISTPSAADEEIDRAIIESIQKLSAFIEENYEDVGEQLPEEARKVYYGEAQARNLRGIAGPDEVHELREEGIEVVPLPANILSGKKLN
jgi:hypothetical protein